MSRKPVAGSAVLLLLFLFRCGDGTPEFAQRFVEVCAAKGNLPEPICECLSKRAQETLSGDARAFLLASLEGDEAKISEARSQMGMTELMAAGLLMTEAGACAESMSDGNFPAELSSDSASR